MKIRFVTAIFAALAVPILFGACTNREGKTDGSVFIESTEEGINCATWNVDPNSSPYVQPDIKNTKFISKTKKTGSDTAFNDVQLTDCWVEYQRIDGGTIVPRRFHFPWSILVPSGGTANMGNARILSKDQLSEAPFDSLAQRGFDPETGNLSIRMRATITWYGRAYSGESIRTTFGLNEEFRSGSGCTNAD